MQLRSVGVFSVARMMGAMYALLGLLFLPFFLLGAAAAMMGDQRLQLPGLAASVGMLALAVILPLLYGVMGFIGGAIGALLYNLMASKLGGVEMDLQPRPAQAAGA